MRSVAAVPALGLVSGTACGLLLPGLLSRPALFALLVLAATVALFGWWGLRPCLVAIGAWLVMGAGGVLLGTDAWARAARPPLRTAFEMLVRSPRLAGAPAGPRDGQAFATVSGRLRSDAAVTPSGVSLDVSVEQFQGNGVGPALAADGGILVTVAGTLAPTMVERWLAGRRVRFPVQLRRPSMYLDPGVPDGERALARRGTVLVGSVKSGALVEVVGHGRWWAEYAGRLRLFTRHAVARSVGRWSAQSAGIVMAIVIGDRTGLDADLQRQLQDAGIYHVIAISGGNIALLAGLLLGMCRLAGALGPRAMVAACVMLVAYAYVVGGGASVDRATLTAVIYLAGRAWDHRSPPLNVLWTVVAVLVAVDPLTVADPAFALTCGATLGILAVAPLTTARRWPPLVGVLASMGAASLAAEAVLFPVGALVFSRISLAGLALNFLAIPLMAVAQIAGMTLVVTAWAPSALTDAVGWVAHFGAAGLVWSAGLVRFIPALAYRVAPPSWTAMTIYYASVALGWWLWRRRVVESGSSEASQTAWMRRIASATAAVAAAWMLFDPPGYWASRGDGRLHASFLDVGQGDSVLVQFPRGTTMLVDAGGLGTSSTFDIGDRVVGPALRALGVRRLDYLALSHGDPDHIGGARTVLREFRPREIWEGIPVPQFEPLAVLRREAQSLGLRWSNVFDGDRFTLDGVEVAVRHPMPAEWERPRVRNDDSLVLEVRWHDVSLLLTGDIGAATEARLARTRPSGQIRVLKVPHHGSLTSSSVEFLRAVRPVIAVVSAGRDNRFGHPAPEVLARYHDAGAAMFRTDQDGAVRIDTDGHSIDVHTFGGRALSMTPPNGAPP